MIVSEQTTSLSCIVTTRCGEPKTPWRVMFYFSVSVWALAFGFFEFVEEPAASAKDAQLATLGSSIMRNLLSEDYFFRADE
ncbi:MAG TPA: hypothetical protein PLY87_30525 [Planctomycetaceae bacterium]|nr:hypothetical protein [Planctomycetaceae bacterium]